MGIPNTFTANTKIQSAQVNANFTYVDPTTGWINPSDTWTYASATTINVPTGAASIYSVGDKIKLTQTTVKYFYIVTVADTLLTVTGGTDYTVANAAISANYYSHATSPVGFPAQFAWSGGYLRMTDGLFECWGDTSAISVATGVGSGYYGRGTDITFPITYATNNPQVFLADNDADNTSCFGSAVNKSTTKFTPQAVSVHSGETPTMSWRAIGKV
jgi:hypothetical protein